MKVLSFFSREFKITMGSLSDLLTTLLFFFLSIFVFIFAIGSDKEILNSIGIGIIWSLLLLSSTLSLKRYYNDDFENNSIVVIHMSGFSYEIISILKIISHFIFIQIPFLFSIPLACILINLSFDKIIFFLLSFMIGSLILSCLGSIASSMNLLNKTNFSLGSIIVMLFSIPTVIFSVGLINADNNFYSMLNILFGILLIFLAISPWISGLCIRIALENR
ncbi:MAG: hypothetical protein CMP16_01920 [Rickettsiales bacterium]|nr:hypothetical protein [Rickettsiales bacterium]